MAVQVHTFQQVPDWLLELVASHLPFSLPILRRLQFTKFQHGTTDHARVVIASRDGLEKRSQPFTVTYVDVSAGPDTHMWLYSTMEDGAVDQVSEAEYGQQLDALLQRLVQLHSDYGKKTFYPGCVLLGSVQSEVRAMLERSGRVVPRPTGNYDKWLFKTQSLPQTETTLPEGMFWDRASLEDCHVVVSRTNLPRSPEKLVTMPSLVIKLADGTPVVWAFLGPDGSLMSLHTEEPYRGRGLAKILAAKLLREKTKDFGTGSLGSADVAADNLPSRGVCKSLNGSPLWVVSWILLNIEEKPMVNLDS